MWERYIDSIAVPLFSNPNYSETSKLREAIIKKKFCFYGHFPYGGGGLNPIP